MTEVDRIWYLRRSDGEGSVGPFSTEQLRDQWEKGLLEEAAEGWKEGMPDWRPLADIEPFASTPRVASDAPGIVRFDCECGNQIVMSAKFIGRLAKCKVCGRTVTVHDPAEMPDLPVKKAEKKKKEEGRPAWMVPAIVVAALVIVAGAVIYFAVSGSGEGDRVAAAPEERESRIARARSELIEENPLDQGRRSRPAAQRPPEEQDRTSGASTEPGRTDQGSRDTGPVGSNAAEQEPGEAGSPAGEQAVNQDAEEEPEPEDEPVTGSAEEKAVKNTAREFVEAFRSKNATPIDRLAELLADDCVVVEPTGGLVEGKELNMEAFIQSIERNLVRFRTLRARYKIAWIRVFSDSAVTCGEFSKNGTLKARGKASTEVLWTTMMFEKVEGQWRIIGVHFTPVVRSSGPAG